MRLTSLRFRILLLTVFFSLVLVGTVSLVTYVVVTDAMREVATNSLRGIADTVQRETSRVAEQATEAARAQGVSPSEADALVYGALSSYLAEVSDTSVGTSAEFALYDTRLVLKWRTSPDALNDHDAHRIAAQSGSVHVDSGRAALQSLDGLFSKADLGEYVSHVGVQLPDGGVAVVDVTYMPLREEAAIDRIRPWMTALAVAAVFIAIALMQASTGWVLGLVGDLRRAAESIDANQLDVRLPDLGRNEVGDLTRSLNALIDRLRRRADAQTRFVADASHELATPVAGIVGYVNILKEWGAEDPELRREAIEALDRESARMARLCSDLLALVSRDRFVEPTIERVDVNAVVRDALARTATRYLGKGLEFTGPEEGRLFAQTDADRLAQLLDILLDNAAKYTPGGGGVAVRTRRRMDKVVIEVADTGVGIPKKDLPHIFDRFYRSDRSRSSDSGGFGIGLSVAHGIVEMLKGEIEAESAEGVGTTFTISLPVRWRPSGRAGRSGASMRSREDAEENKS